SVSQCGAGGAKGRYANDECTRRPLQSPHETTSPTYKFARSSHPRGQAAPDPNKKSAEGLSKQGESSRLPNVVSPLCRGRHAGEIHVCSERWRGWAKTKTGPARVPFR